jgi:hypothetical protein
MPFIKENFPCSEEIFDVEIVTCSLKESQGDFFSFFKEIWSKICLFDCRTQKTFLISLHKLTFRLLQPKGSPGLPETA